MTNDSKTALITGASSGIGVELARIHAERGGDLVLVARRQDRLEALKADLETAHGIRAHLIVKDLARPEAAAEIHDELTSRGVNIDYLINNAGFGYGGFFHEQDWARNEAMIQVNVTALAALMRRFLPEMVARGSGRILNVASMAGFLPGPLQATYYASKAFVVSFSEAIGNELAGTGVTVTALCPGPVDTEFIEKANLRQAKGFARPVAVRGVAEAGYDAMLKGKPVIVPGLVSKLIIHLLLRLTPRRCATAISRAMMAKKT
ncbi:SDR family NAD(P)-dependent oxidoreductase [Anaerobaca lacustris]|uniref:SDR family oxidoreductase n=1 Tax=Anaerobaca lacustris TaxID=3044600 RepID=A0AAW6TXC2_9BACT|nr:SDR family oxidoreductase [Sedimentisphaerales bacterium M17dextr]